MLRVLKTLIHSHNTAVSKPMMTAIYNKVTDQLTVTVSVRVPCCTIDLKCINRKIENKHI